MPIRTLAGLTSARARGRKGGRKFQLTKGQVRLSQVCMKHRDANVRELCKELKLFRQTLYRHISAEGELRAYGIQDLKI